MTGYACGAQTYEDVRTRVQVQLCYASIFGDAPTVQELLGRSGASTPTVVEAEIERLVSEGGARLLGDRVVLGRNGAPVSHDPAALQAALDEHRIVLSYLQRSSLVRMLAVSGSLAHARPRTGGKGTPDLDLFIVCAPSSVHLLRFFLRLSDLVRALRWPGRRQASRSTLCPNYVTEVSYLEVSNPSLYTATDSLSVRVLKGERVYRSFLAANRWIARYYPGSVTDTTAGELEERAPLARAASNLLFFGVMATASTLKSIVRRSARVYSLRRRSERGITLHRTEATGGGHEPAVARRFVAVYREHFGDDPDLFGFLFPGWQDPKNRASPPGWPELGYDA